MNTEKVIIRSKFVTWLIILSAIPAFAILVTVFVTLSTILFAILSGIDFKNLGAFNQEHELFSDLSTQIAQFISIVIIVKIYWVAIFKNSTVSIGFQFTKTTGKEVLQGFLTGVFLIAIIFVILLFTGQIEISSIQFSFYHFLFYLLLFALVGINEELLFRGYLLGTTMKIANKYVVLAIFASLFSLVHFLTNDFSFFPIMNIFLAGILLGQYYIHTKRLWFSISLHFTWNFLLGPVFGSNVSGNVTNNSIIQQNIIGKNWLTGGEFGFEGSMIMTIILIALILGLEVYFKKKSAKSD